MLYVLLAASALAALICCIVLLKTGRDEQVKHRPQWQDEITDEEYEADNPTPWRRDPPAWKNTNCRNCGAPLVRGQIECEYCGTSRQIKSEIRMDSTGIRLMCY